MMPEQQQQQRRRARGRRRPLPLPLPSAAAALLLALLAMATMQARVCWGFRGPRVSSSVARGGGSAVAATAAASRRGRLRVLSTAAAPESSSSSSSPSSSPSVEAAEEADGLEAAAAAAEAGPTMQRAPPVLSSRGGSSPLQGTLLEPYHYVVPPLVAAQHKAWRGVHGQRRWQQEQAEAAAAEGQAVGVISHHEALELLCLREGVGGRGGRKGFYYHEGVSLDLGRTETMVVVSEEGISLPAIRDRSRRGKPALVAAWEELEEIVAAAQAAPHQGGQLGCYALYADGTRPWRISVVSLKTGRAANLLPSRYVKGPPTVVLGSFLMHRLDGPRPGSYIGPAEDTRRKLDAVKMKKVYGKVLDTTTGLGYTAIAAARCAHVSEVVTIEADQAALEMCRYNPWSSDLFLHSQQQQAGVAAPPHGDAKRVSPIHVLQGDVCELVKGFGDGTFAAVMHDPPAMALGGKASSALYSAAFYSELYRVLRWRGRLFHFVGGNPKGKENSRLYKSVVQRLEAAGFKKVMILASAQGVVAEKGEDRKSKKALHSPNGQGGGGGGGGRGSRPRRGGPGHRGGYGGDFLGWGGGEFGWEDGYGAAFGFL